MKTFNQWYKQCQREGPAKAEEFLVNCADIQQSTIVECALEQYAAWLRNDTKIDDSNWNWRGT